MYERNIDTRFWGKVDKKGSEECWNWLATTGPRGYGGFSYLGKRWNAHKLAYILTYGEVPKGRWVLHRCNNSRCCNPNHLYLGSPSDNERDEKNSGIVVYPYKLKPKEINQIKDLRKVFTLAKIGELYNINPATVWKYCKL